ncbi:MAG: T9SS type A sorting domain-containing protein [Bacteroidetes bacterium]|nr:T9SS type A sorting domain-containing protein [Bacteroidota bacterium]
MKTKIFFFLTNIALCVHAQQNDCPPYLILLQGGTNYTQSCGVDTRTKCVIQNINTIESMPFDGMSLNMVASWGLMKPGQSFSYNAIYNELGPLKGIFKKFTKNFVTVNINNPGDLFDDVVWNTVISNFKNLAQAAKDAGLVGIFFDNEEYDLKWMNFPEDYPGTTKTVKQYQDQSELRGKQIMQAIVSIFPKAIILVYHGPYLSEPKTPSYVTMQQVAGASYYELLGPFFVGLVEGKGTQATVIDGGEVYQYRTASDFKKSYDWRKDGIASSNTNCAFISQSLRSIWHNSVNISFGVYNRAWKTGYPMNPGIMKTTLINALTQSDSYVWYYTESDDWAIPGKMPQQWIDSVSYAKSVAANNRCLTSIVATDEQKFKVDIYPNPSNQSSVISYQLINNSEVKISVYDLLGKEIMKLAEENQNAGGHQLNFNAENLKNGVYFIKVIISGREITEKFIVNKN